VTAGRMRSPRGSRVGKQRRGLGFLRSARETGRDLFFNIRRIQDSAMKILQKENPEHSRSSNGQGSSGQPGLPERAPRMPPTQGERALLDICRHYAKKWAKPLARLASLPGL